MPCPDRRRELARIHIAARSLCLDRETYVALLQRGSAGLGVEVDSAAGLDATGRHALLREFARLGCKEEGQATRHRIYGGRPEGIADCPVLRKIEALLADAQRPWRYARALGKRMHRVDHLEWLNPMQLRELVAALQIDAKRRQQRDRQAAAMATKHREET